MISTPTELLAFESRGWIHAAAKVRADADELGLSPVRYYQMLAQAMNDPAAVAAHPNTAARLRWIAEPGGAADVRRPLRLKCWQSEPLDHGLHRLPRQRL